MARIGLVGFGGIGIELAKILVYDPTITADIVAYDIPQALEQVPGLQRGAYAEIVDAIGILGGGQLGRYALMAAATMGYRTIVLDPDPSAPAVIATATNDR